MDDSGVIHDETNQAQVTSTLSEEGAEALRQSFRKLAALLGGKPKKGHTKWRRERTRSVSRGSRGYRKPAACNQQFVEAAYRRREQDRHDAERQVRAQVAWNGEKVSDLEIQNRVLRRAVTLTEERGSW